MKLKIVSDLHLECSDVEITNEENADILILAGDILEGYELNIFPHLTIDTLSKLNVPAITDQHLSIIRYRSFLKSCSENFKHVIYIAGNHEFHHGRIISVMQHLRTECLKYPNIHFLENEHTIIDNVVFFGATLWTDMNQTNIETIKCVQTIKNDYRYITNDKRGYRILIARDTIEFHNQTKKILKKILDEHKDKRCVVVTHHSPTFQSIHPKYKNEFHLNGSYASDLEEFILKMPQIKLWAHGHIHYASDYKIGGTRIVCNPRGFETVDSNEQTGWNENKFIEI
jgi:Icc-related predicted phosphoesterase